MSSLGVVPDLQCNFSLHLLKLVFTFYISTRQTCKSFRHNPPRSRQIPPIAWWCLIADAQSLLIESISKDLHCYWPIYARQPKGMTPTFLHCRVILLSEAQIPLSVLRFKWRIRKFPQCQLLICWAGTLTEMTWLFIYWSNDIKLNHSGLHCYVNFCCSRWTRIIVTGCRAYGILRSVL